MRCDRAALRSTTAGDVIVVFVRVVQVTVLFQGLIRQLNRRDEGDEAHEQYESIVSVPPSSDDRSCRIPRAVNLILEPLKAN